MRQRNPILRKCKEGVAVSIWLIKGKQARELREIHQKLCQDAGNNPPISLNDVVKVMAFVGLANLRKMTVNEFLEKLKEIEK